MRFLPLIIFLSLLCFGALSWAQCPADCDQTVTTGNTITSTASGEKICVDANLTLSSWNINHTNVLVYVCTGRSVTVSSFFNPDAGDNGFTLETAGTITFNANVNYNGGEGFDYIASGGGTFNWTNSINISNRQVRFTADSNSTFNFNSSVTIQGASAAKRAELNVEPDATMTFSSGLTLNGRVDFNNNNSTTITGNFTMQNGDIDFFNGCGESSFVATGSVNFPSGSNQVITNGGIVQGQTVVINTGTNGFLMEEGAKIIATNQFQNNTTNSIDYIGIGGECATINLQNNSYTINNDLTNHSEIYWCCPTCSPQPANLGSATTSCFDCNTTYKTDCNVVLPITFGFFEVSSVGHGNLIMWSSTMESNVSHFVILSSVDGIAYERLVTIPAEGNSDSELVYEYLDPVTRSGETYYKVIAVDYDGARAKSGVRSIMGTWSESYVFPNPSSGELISLMVAVELSQEGRVYLTDALGRNLPATFDILEGAIQAIPASPLPPGAYCILYQDENGTFSNTFSVH